MSDTTQDQTAETTAVARRSPQWTAEIEARRLRAAAATAVRGTQWGKECSEEAVRAVSRYCVENGLDPMRHVEVLGGRIYLTETLYSEKAAPYVRAGLLILEEPDLIMADARLDELAVAGDEWAKEERTRRMRARIKYGVPEIAEGASVQRIRVASSGAVIVGVNWCGKGVRMQEKEIWEKNQRTGRFAAKDMDPIGGLEPVKTAITRARRRAWIQLLEGTSIDLGVREDLERLHTQAQQANEEIEAGYERAEVVAAPKLKALPVPGPTEYGGNANPGTSEVLAGVTVTNAEDVPKRTFPPAHTLGNPYPGDVPDLEPPAPPVAATTTDDDEDEEPFR